MKTLGCLLLLLTPTFVVADTTKDISALLATPTRENWDRVVNAGLPTLLPILQAWTDDSTKNNWLRTAFDAIAKAPKAELPLAELKAFLADAKRPGSARRVVLATLERHTPGFTPQQLEGWLNDPEFGADAVEHHQAKAEKLPEVQKLAAFEKLFTSCRDFDQSQALAKKLTTLGAKPNVWKHLGVIEQWHLVGPFPVSPEDGLVKSFPPESEIDLSKEYPGKTSPLRWTAARTDEADGRIELSKAGVKSDDGSVCYAAAKFALAQPATVELRLSAVDNITAWVNGKKAVERSNDYRSLYRTDRYRATLELPKGNTTILLKLTKTRPDEGQQAAAARGGRPGGLSTKWDFQARLLDDAGSGLSFTQSDAKK
jgi:hypothetical protein